MNITFVTGNQHKANKTARLLGRAIDHTKLELDEIQTRNITELAERKVRQAYAELQKPVIIDDFGLGLDGLSGLPGPFIKFFVQIDDGLEKLCRIADSLGSRRASVDCVIAFYDGITLKTFETHTPGELATHPIGSNGIDTDRIFKPDGYNQTRAQMNDQTYDEVYKLVRPLGELKAFLDEYYGEL